MTSSTEQTNREQQLTTLRPLDRDEIALLRNLWFSGMSRADLAKQYRLDPAYLDWLLCHG